MTDIQTHWHAVHNDPLISYFTFYLTATKGALPIISSVSLAIQLYFFKLYRRTAQETNSNIVCQRLFGTVVLESLTISFLKCMFGRSMFYNAIEQGLLYDSLSTETTHYP